MLKRFMVSDLGKKLVDWLLPVGIAADVIAVVWLILS